MKKVLLGCLFVACLFNSHAFSTPIEMGISKEQYIGGNRVIDSATGLPIAGAEITVPQKNYKVYTNADGYFSIHSAFNSPTIVSVQKEGYRNFSTTLLPYDKNGPISLSLVKEKVGDIELECSLCHLGDDSFSENSANSGDFKTKAVGPFYSKIFKMPSDIINKTNYLVIGSIIGIDTKMARNLGQNRAPNSYASAPEVYFNGTKIAEIQVNGDNQRIKIPTNLIKADAMNEVIIRTGHNLYQMARLDYDDIEFVNLSVQSE